MTFANRQRVAVRRILLGVMPDGERVFWDDWTQIGIVRATKRDRAPDGYCIVHYGDGDRGLCIPVEQLRAV